MKKDTSKIVDLDSLLNKKESTTQTLTESVTENPVITEHTQSKPLPNFDAILEE